MRTVIASIVCSALFAGVIAQAEESSAQLTPPVTAKTAPKGGSEKIDTAAINEGNFWIKFNKWDALMEGKNGMPKDEVKAGQLLAQLVKGVYLVKFGTADGFNPQTPGEFLQAFHKTSSLQSGKDRLGGSGFFRTKRDNNKLMASFLTEQPDQMKQDIEKNPQFVFISMEEITPDKFISHVKSAQESLRNESTQNISSEQPDKNIATFHYAIQAEDGVAYEVNLDGKFVACNKAQKQYSYSSLCATPGDHILAVTAPGYETWQKTITLLEGSQNWQGFVIELKKLPTVTK